LQKTLKNTSCTSGYIGITPFTSPLFKGYELSVPGNYHQQNPAAYGTIPDGVPLRGAPEKGPEGTEPSPPQGADQDLEESSFFDEGPRHKSQMRRCLVRGHKVPSQELLRFVIAPDGVLCVDVAGRLPGRGLWVGAERHLLETALAKRLFAKVARQPVTISENLLAEIGRQLKQRLRETVALARRAGIAIAGFEKVREALKAQKVGVLIAAEDGALDGRVKLRHLAKASSDNRIKLVESLSCDDLATAFARHLVVHAAIAPGQLAERLVIGDGLWQRFCGAKMDGDAGMQKEFGVE
jgi:uncharacterized protein